MRLEYQALKNNDEISTKDYIRMKKTPKRQIAGIMALDTMSKLPFAKQYTLQMHVRGNN